MWPNPASDLLHIEADGLQQVEIINLMGRTVLTSQQATLNVKALPTGAYFVRITTDKGTEVTRLVVRD